MPKPLDVYFGEELAPERQAAIDAVRESGLTDDNSMEFWDRVRRVQDICSARKTDPKIIARACAIVEPHLSSDGDRGDEGVFHSDIERLIFSVAQNL